MTGLRAEVRAVLSGPGAAPAWQALQAGAPGESDPRPLYRLLGRHRLLAPNWPAAFGGRDEPASAAAIVAEELIAAGVPEVLHTLSVQICGNFLLSAGSPEQRAALLPPMAAGVKYCTVLYTEPDVGSDLAALATVAESDGSGGWLLTGRKLYSVRTGLASTGLVAARTERGRSQYQGITLFLMPLTAPGVTVAALPSLADEAFADVRLSRVRVAGDSVVGQAGAGWPLITAALALERTGVDYVAKAETWLRAWQVAAAEPPEEQRARAGQLWTQVRAGRALSRRCVSELDTGQVDPVNAAVAKLWTSETAREVAWWSSEALHDAGLAGPLEAAYREAPGLTISAGTSEMMCELIAAAGLPAGPEAESGLVGDMRRAVRWTVTSPQDEPGACAPRADWPVLASFGAFSAAVPEAAGGYGIGLPAALGIAAELGAAGYDSGLLDTLTAIDILAAAQGSALADRQLPALLAGQRAAALVYQDRPGRPVTDPGPDGLVLIIAADRCAVLADGLRSAGLTVTRLPGDAALHTARACDSSATDAGRLCPEVVAADLLRRAAWLTGAGWSALTAAITRARSRQQFGRSLIEYQSVAFRLARLTAHGRAMQALIGSAGDPGVPFAAGALAQAGRFAASAARESVHLHGAFGMVRETPVAQLYRLVRVMIAQCPPARLLDLAAAEPNQ